jgi:RNA polymerase sigma-70 factor (ECF subfamily)
MRDNPQTSGRDQGSPISLRPPSGVTFTACDKSTGRTSTLVREPNVELLLSNARDAAPDSPLAEPVRATSRVDERAFERVYQAHHGHVYRYVLGLTRSHADADEVAGETFARAYVAWQEVPDPPLPWLLSVARRIATDRWRRARRFARLAVRRPGPPPDAGEQATEFWLWFEAVARVLTDRQREALVLRYHDDLSDADIAAIMGMSESGVRSLVARALDALRARPELL